MSDTIPTLVDRLDLEEIEPGRLYRGDVYTHLQKAFGGQVLAESLLASEHSVGDDREVHSLHAYFLQPGDPTVPVLYDVESTREGRSFSSRRVIARQAGRNIFQAAFSYHVPEPGLDHGDPPPLNVPPPDECPVYDEDFAHGHGLSALHFDLEKSVLDIRYVGDSRQGTGSIASVSHGAHLRLWVRVATSLPADPVWHKAALAYVSDLSLLGASTLPHPVTMGQRGMMTASVDHSMWFHRRARADQWLLYDQTSPSASSALGFSMGRMFQDGVLVASCAQEGLIRVLDPARVKD